MWEALRDIARAEGIAVNGLVTAIDRQRDGLGLTAAIRVYIVDFYRRDARLRETAAALPVTASSYAASAKNARKSSAPASRMT